MNIFILTQLFDKEDKGHITRDELQTIIRQAFDAQDSEELFTEIDAQNDNKITYGLFTFKLLTFH